VRASGTEPGGCAADDCVDVGAALGVEDAAAEGAALGVAGCVGAWLDWGCVAWCVGCECWPASGSTY